MSGTVTDHDSPSLPPGTRLKDWEIVAYRGAGSYAAVYEARYRGRRRRMPKRAALKVFDGLAIMAREAMAALDEEAAAMRAVVHSNVVRLYDDVTVPSGRHKGTRFFVLELADTDLFNHFHRHGPVMGTEAHALARDVAAGLAATHQAGFVHGDVKPENVLLFGNVAKISDLGSSARLEGSGGFVTGSTPLYMPPEDRLRPPERDRKPGRIKRRPPGDVWALGVTLHMAVTGGLHPYKGDSDDDIFISVGRGERRTDVVVDDPAMRQIIEQCLTYEVGERPSSLFVAIQTVLYLPVPPAPPTARPVREIAAEVARTQPTLGGPRRTVAIAAMYLRLLLSPRSLGRFVAVLLITFLLLTAGALSQRSMSGYYLGAGDDGTVQIYDGPPNGFLWFKGRPVASAGTRLSDLPADTQRRVRSGIKAGRSVEDAREQAFGLAHPPEETAVAPTTTAVAAAATTSTSTTAQSRPVIRRLAPRKADIEVVGYAIAGCPCFEDFTQVKALTKVTNTGNRSFPIGAGNGSPWRLLVEVGGKDTAPAVRTPAPLQYSFVEHEGRRLWAVPPNPPGKTVFPDMRDFATLNFPEAADLAPWAEPYYVAPRPVRRRDVTVHRGSTLVFNLPTKENLTVRALALVIDGRIVDAVNYADWGTAFDEPNEF